MGSWTGKYDPVRQLGVATKKAVGFNISPLNSLHMKLSDKAHSAADTYLNQETEGPGAPKRKEDKRLADYSAPLARSRLKADNARRLTIMRSI